MATFESFQAQTEALVLADYNNPTTTLGDQIDSLFSTEPSWVMSQTDRDSINAWQDTWKNAGIFNWRDLFDLIWAVLKAIWDAIFG